MSALATGKRKHRWGQALLWASIAAWAVYLVFALSAAFFVEYFQADGRPGLVSFNFAFAIVVFPFALAICLLIGGPALLVADILKLTRWWQAALIGALGGLLAALFLTTALGGLPSAQLDGQIVLGLTVFSFAGACAGACAGVTAWSSLWLDGKYRGRPPGVANR